MSNLAREQFVPHSQLEQLREGRRILKTEADALLGLAQHLSRDFCDAVDALFRCQGRVIVTGVGKAGLIGQKIAATLSSTGTRSHFLHPVEAVHGDLGCVDVNDTLLVLSNSGESAEVCRLLPVMKRWGVTVIAITADRRSTLGVHADFVLSLGRLEEAGRHALAPSTTTTAMLALGDALALVVSRMKDFQPQHFAVIHPGGRLGMKLKTVRELMRHDSALRIATEETSVRDVFVQIKHPGRRSGAVMLTDTTGRLTGLFTDSDLARLLEQRLDEQLDRPISAVMTHEPTTISADARLTDAIEILSEKKVSELPVVDEDGKPIGLIDITDVIGEFPQKTDITPPPRSIPT